MNEFDLLNEVVTFKGYQQKLSSQIITLSNNIEEKKDIVDSIDTHISLVENEIWWIRFQRFCNTSCWKFVC